MGGDCLNYGCVPSKALLAAASVAHAQGGNAAMGIGPSQATINYGAAKDFVASVIGQIAPHDSEVRFEGLGVTVIEDFGGRIRATCIDQCDFNAVLTAEMPHPELT